jgi:ASC-1-like (ASCH) protein
MTVIHKKITPEYFDLVQSGRKRYEFRVADFAIAEGDTLVLEEWDPKNKKYTGRTLEKKVGYTSHFTLDSFSQRELIEKHGFYIVQFE